jgi:Rrf2 family protein
MLSAKAKYGLKALLFLADLEDRRSVQVAEIAEAEGISKRFLDAILLQLKTNGLLHSRKGPGGGYALGRPPEKIIIGDVVRVLDGPLAPIPCASQTAYRRCEDCADEETCRIRRAMRQVRDAVAGILDGMTLADLQKGDHGAAFAVAPRKPAREPAAKRP